MSTTTHHQAAGTPPTPGAGGAPTTHQSVLDWVAEAVALTTPRAVVWIDGSDAQWSTLANKLIRAGTFTAVQDPPNSFHAASSDSDVARVEDRTFICSPTRGEAGPTNNWVDPAEMKATMTELYRGCMTGRTLYVIPFCMGPLDAPYPKLGVQITDSEYVVGSMRIMTRVGTGAIRLLEQVGEYVQCLHSLGAPLAEGEVDVPWPCNDTKYISHFPADLAVWSFGSGYGGNALLGKKCYSLRIASVMARDEGWLAEHMLILKLISPDNTVHYIAAAFPSACGKTNLAMLAPTIPGWRAEMVGDDIAWMRFGDDGRLYATNPEYGLFGVAPGTGWSTNPNAMRTIGEGNTVFTNVAATDDGGVWWEGMTDTPPAHLIDWKGREWTPTGQDPAGEVLASAGQPAAHPNSRFCTPITSCPILAEEYNSPNGVPISAIVFGGRRKTTIPLITQARSWQHGVFLGATLSSETTAAAAGAVGVLRRDPMAMLPFLGYDAGNYLEHWLTLDRPEANLPEVFYVNWFRRDTDGGFLWPGYGENSRVMKWIVQRLEGTVGAAETPLGLVPQPGDLDVAGLNITAQALQAAFAVDSDEWAEELPRIREWFGLLGHTLPDGLNAELAELNRRLREAHQLNLDTQKQ